MPSEGGRLFLTFDDGPLPCTARILDLLATTGHKATFFVVGRNLNDPKLRELSVRALKEGHDIGNHSYDHPNFAAISSQRAVREIVTTAGLIRQVVQDAGVNPARQNLFFRFPYGVAGSRSNYSACQEALAELNYRIAWWDLDTHDWRMELPWFPRRPATVLASLNRARPNDVVLLHDRLKTAQHLSPILHKLDDHKLTSIPLSDLDSNSEVIPPPDKKERADPTLKSFSPPDEDALAEELSRGLVSQEKTKAAARTHVFHPFAESGLNLW
jgi:peptidoglycan/xylan/chitin deacetylase (PgdA/CDA1 family)